MKRLFDNTSFSFIDYAVLVGLNLVATPFLIDNFGVEGYGAFIFLNIFSIYGALAVFDLGMEGSLMNYVARFQAAGQQREMRAAVTVSIVYYAVIGAVVAMLLYFGSDLLASRLLGDDAALDSNMLHTAIVLVAINAFIQFLQIPLTATLQGMRRYVLTKSISSGTNILRYVLLVVIALLYHRIDAGFVVVLGMSVVRLAGVSFALFRKTPEFRGWTPELDWTMFRKLFSYSSLLFITRVIGLVHNQSPKALIWYFLTVATMTVYDVIARPAMLLRTILGVVVSALVPEVARLHQQGDTRGIIKLYINLVRYSYMFLLPILAILFVHIDDLILLWVGERFVPEASLALILLAGYFVVPISAVANTMVVGLEQVRQTIWIPIAGTVLNLLLSVALVQSWGLSGLLVGTLVSQIFTFYPYARFMHRFLGFQVSMLIRPIAPVFLAAGASGAINLVARFGLAGQTWPLMAVAAVTVSVNFLITGRFLLTPDERRFLIDRWRDIRAKLSTAFERD